MKQRQILTFISYTCLITLCLYNNIANGTENIKEPGSALCNISSPNPSGSCTAANLIANNAVQVITPKYTFSSPIKANDHISCNLQCSNIECGPIDYQNKGFAKAEIIITNHELLNLYPIIGSTWANGSVIINTYNGIHGSLSVSNCHLVREVVSS